MKALILDDKVIEVAEKEFPVHESMVWVNCLNNVQAGWTYIKKEFKPPVIEISAPVNPILLEIVALENQITNRRLREAVLGIDGGWLFNINEQIKNLRGQL